MDIGLLLRSQPVRRAVCGLRLRPCMALRTAGNTFAAIGASGGNGTGGMRRRFTGHAPLTGRDDRAMTAPGHYVNVIYSYDPRDPELRFPQLPFPTLLWIGSTDNRMLRSAIQTRWSTAAAAHGPARSPRGCSARSLARAAVRPRRPLRQPDRNYAITAMDQGRGRGTRGSCPGPDGWRPRPGSRGGMRHPWWR